MSSPDSSLPKKPRHKSPLTREQQIKKWHSRDPNSTAPQAGRAYIKRPEEKKLRAVAMLRARMKMSKEDVAKEFNLHVRTVERNLSWARKAGILANEEDRILDDMVPMARELLLKAMQHELTKEGAPDPQVALAVFNGIGLFKKPGTKAAAFPGTGESELEAYINKIRIEAGLAENTIEGQVMGEQKALPPASPAAEEDPTE